MSDLRLILQSCLGGGVVGGFPGIFVGGLLGVLCGLFLGDLSLGLDGALLGGGVGCLGGGLYGIYLALREMRTGADFRSPASTPPAAPEQEEGLARTTMLHGRTEGSPAPTRNLAR